MPGLIGPTVSAAKLTLAQSSRTPPTVDIMFWLGVLLVICIVGFVFVTWLKKRLDAEEAESLGSVMDSFGLSDLRRLHREGQLSDEEFERAKHKMLVAAGAIEPDAEDDDTDDAEPDTPASPSAEVKPQPANGSVDLDEPLGPELLPDTQTPHPSEDESRKRDCEPESEDDSKRGFD